LRMCSKYRKDYDKVPAKSRADNSEIYRSCSKKEVVEIAVSVGAIITKQAVAILETL